MPRSKKTINLEHSNVAYVNQNGDKATADFRHTDAMEAFLDSQKDNEAEAADSAKVARVYRVSRLGERLLARFKGSSASDDAETFADQCNEVYDVRGFYKAETR